MSRPPAAADDQGYAEALAELFALERNWARDGDTGEAWDLDQTRALLTALGQPHLRWPSVHVAGTNGKGTTAHAVAALAQSAGLRIGLYTSPHYVDFAERIRVDGRPAEHAWIAAWLREHLPLARRLNASYFETAVAMAFAYFAERGVELAVVEVGMGGRLDSTNVITPLVSVVTNIGLDHVAQLGPTLAHIAREKAGIVKPYTPLVVGRRQAETEAVFAEATRAHHAHLSYAPPLAPDDPLVDASGLVGPFVAENLAAAAAAWRIAARRHPLRPAEAPRLRGTVLELTGYRGRFQRLRENPLTLLDAGHNVDAWARSVPALLDLAAGRRLHLVVGLTAGRDATELLRLLPNDARVYTGPIAFARRAVSKDVVAEAAAPRKVHVAASLTEAYQAALKAATTEDAVLVIGSSFAVGDVLAYEATRDKSGAPAN